MVIGGQPALSSERPARVRRQEREGTSDLRRHGDEVEFGFAMVGLPQDARSEPAEGSSKRSRQEAPEEMIVSPPQAGPFRKGQSGQREGPIIPRRAANGRLVADRAGTGLPGPKREAGTGLKPKLGRSAFARERLTQAEARTGTAGAERVSGQGSSDRSDANPGSDGRAGWKRSWAARLSRSGSRGRSPGDRAADRDRRDA
jgi:hypothetical protein